MGRCVSTDFSRFVVFWSGACLCLAHLAATLVNSGAIRWGEDGATTIAYFCIFLIFWDLLFLLEYMSVLHEMDDGEGCDEE
jgi:methyl coenzyme M reductase beta subunit